MVQYYLEVESINNLFVHYHNSNTEHCVLFGIEAVKTVRTQYFSKLMGAIKMYA